MRKIGIEEIKKIEVDILKNFRDYCKKNNLKFFLAYGTLLGAVRHKGFIPWDDDIDVVMLRDDYNRLIKEYKDGKYKLMSVERVEKNDYSFAYAKMVDAETYLVEECRPNNKIGVFIDIFPLDYINKLTQRTMIRKRYNRINYLETSKGIKGRIIIAIGRKRLSFINRAMNKKIKSRCKYVANCCSADNADDYYEKEWFDGDIKLDFEGEEFPVPTNYDKVLSAKYGDYQKLPPLDERVPHHSFKAYKIIKED